MTSPYCRWVEELVRRGVAGRLRRRELLPDGRVTRGQMPIFMLKTLDPTLEPPACGDADVRGRAGDEPVCTWIEELVRRGVVGGCGGGNYCPNARSPARRWPSSSAETFGLTLYGP